MKDAVKIGTKYKEKVVKDMKEGKIQRGNEGTNSYQKRMIEWKMKSRTKNI